MDGCELSCILFEGVSVSFRESVLDKFSSGVDEISFCESLEKEHADNNMDRHNILVNVRDFIFHLASGDIGGCFSGGYRLVVERIGMLEPIGID